MNKIVAQHKRNMMKLLIDFDDFHPDDEVDCLPVLKNIFDQRPEVKINFFIPPNYNGHPLYKNQLWCDIVKSYIAKNMIAVGVHGHTHSPVEFAHKNYQEAVSSIRAAEAMFDASGIPFQKVFKGPQWAANASTIEALIDLGYTHLYSHVNHRALNDNYADKIKIVYYNFNFKDEWPTLENPLINPNICVAHGHTSKHPYLDCGNSIWNHYNKILNLPDNTEFLTLNEYI